MFFRSLLVAILLLPGIGLAFPRPVAAAVAVAEQCFPESGQCISGRFAATWNATGGLAQHGFPVSGEFEEVNRADGKAYTVQYFERARFEWHPDRAGTPAEIAFGLIGRELYTARYPTGIAGTSNGHCFGETGHCMQGAFLSYWQSHGGLAQHGFPVSGEFEEVNRADGKAYTVQYFERARFELRPENPAPHDILPGHVGRELLSTAAPAPSGPGPGWRLTFADEFEGAALGPAWRTALPWGGRTNHAANGELQCYQDGNARVSGGSLRLVAERRAVGCDGGTWQYASGAVNTAQAFRQRYGYFEARVRVPAGRGYWPAFWLLHTPDGRSWPWPPEIDILEFLGHDRGTMYHTLHYRDGAGAHRQAGGATSGIDFAAGFHTVAVDWSPGLLVWYVDGVERFRTDEGVPDVAMYLILNLAVGGKWPGAPDRATPFPAEYQVDYVRVYQRP